MRLREKLLFIFFIVWFLLIIARLFYWQLIYSGVLKPQARSQYLREFEISSVRGEVLAADGAPLATNQPAFLVFALPKEIKEPKDVAKKLAPYLLKPKILTAQEATDEALLNRQGEEIYSKTLEIEKKLSRSDLFWVLLARKVSRQTIDQIKSLNIAGIGFESDYSRFYPEASLAAHVLGFTGQDEEGHDKGNYGLEGFYNRELSGKVGRSRLEVDPRGQPILIGGIEALDKKDGWTLQSTIDRSVQYLVERRLEKAVTRYQAKEGSVVVMEPRTGAILAMATFPNYYPGSYSQFDPKLFPNPLVSDNYEPGSTFKIVVMSAALNEKVLNPDDRCKKCSGPRPIANYSIRTWNNKYYEDSTFAQVIEHSDNVGMVEVGEKLGIDRLYNYIKDFGFGEKTEIDLQEEAKGLVRDKKTWKEIDLATASFGQGVSVTALQMAGAAAVIANGGELPRPYLVQKIIKDGRTVEVEPQTLRRVISEEAARRMTQMMINAVEKGEARAFKPKGFTFAGKTGTAQIPVEGHYDAERTIASFVGFGPPDNPKFVILVRFREPTTSKFGSETAAPTFFEIARDLYAYYGIIPR